MNNKTKAAIEEVPCRKLIPPFRLGKKQLRAVLDSQGIEVVVFPKGRESYAVDFVEFLNSKYPAL